MSCKMIDWLLDTSPAPASPWHYIVTALGVQPGQYTHPSVSDHPVCVILRERRLKDIPKSFCSKPLD